MEPAVPVDRISPISPPSPVRRAQVMLLVGLCALSACGRPAAGDEAEPDCRYQLRDAEDNKDSLLQLKTIGVEHYIGTAGLNTATPWSVEVEVLAGGELYVDRSLVPITRQLLTQQYRMKSDQRRTFVSVDGHSCEPVERSLLYYLVLEWFP